MSIPSPVGWLAPARQNRVWVLCVILMLLIGGALLALDVPLQTQAAPWGIVSFEFAGTLAGAEQVLTSWGERGRVSAGLSLGLDYLFLVVYGSTLALLCVRVARGFTPRWAWLYKVGLILAWMQVGAALLDAMENYALIRLLLGSASATWPPVAWWCAGLKFALLGVGLLYLAIGLVLRLTLRPHRMGPPAS